MRKLFIFSVLAVLLFVSCGKSLRTNNWISICKSHNVKELNNYLATTNAENILNIYEELSKIEYKNDDGHIYFEDDGSYPALLYMHFGLQYLEQNGDIDLSEEQKTRLKEIRNTADVMLLYPAMMKDVTFNKIVEEYKNLNYK